MIEPRAHLVHDNRVRNHGRLVEFEADCLQRAHLPRLRRLLRGADDAADRRGIPASRIWAHSYFDYELVHELQPDVVVTVVSRARHDRGAVRHRARACARLEAQKRAAGDVMRTASRPSRRASNMPPHVSTRRRRCAADGAPAGRRERRPRAEALDLPPSIRDGKVIEGRDGRLFLANDANRVLDQHSGDLRFAEDQLRQWRHLLETRTAWLERRGRRHYFLIAPDAHSVYPDVAARGRRRAPRSARSTSCSPTCATHESYARVVYPLEASLVATGERRVPEDRLATGPPYGAFVACRALRRGDPRDVPIGPACRRRLSSSSSWTTRATSGAKVRPPLPGRAYIAPVDPSAARAAA